jgi:hypothetical protein
LKLRASAEVRGDGRLFGYRVLPDGNNDHMDDLRHRSRPMFTAACGLLLASIAAALVAPFLAQGQSPTKSDITISAERNPIVYGGSTTISGRVKGTLKAGALLTLQQLTAPYTGDYENVATTTAGTNGAYGFNDVSPEVTSRFRVASTLPQGMSADLPVQVRIRVTLRLSDSTPRAGTRVRFSGTAAPEHDGRLVFIQRRTFTGGWRTVKKTPLNDAGSEFSKYSTRIRVRRNGAYRARVFHDSDHLDGTSRKKRAIVH